MTAPDATYWQRLDELVASAPLVIDRPKGSRHPNWPDIIYPIDYGYLGDTRGSDGSEVDVWRGTAREGRLDAVVCTADLGKRDVEVKLLLGCTAAEKDEILRFHGGGGMGALLVERGS